MRYNTTCPLWSEDGSGLSEYRRVRMCGTSGRRGYRGFGIGQLPQVQAAEGTKKLIAAVGESGH